jgi:hypothetical protein
MVAISIFFVVGIILGAIGMCVLHLAEIGRSADIYGDPTHRHHS